MRTPLVPLAALVLVIPMTLAGAANGSAALRSPATVVPLAGSDWKADGNQPGANFGGSVATAGDVNGDGYDDVVVGAIDYDNGQTNEGRVFVYHGSASGLSATPNWTAESNQRDSYFGVNAGTAGDVNGDGFDDVIVGAPRYDNVEHFEGRAYVYHGSPTGLSLTPNWTAEGDQDFAQLGWYVGTAGDVNGDGFDDVIVSSFIDEGRSYVYYGSTGGLSLTPNWTADGIDLGVVFLGSVGTAGDVNGDGFDDVIIQGEFSEGGHSTGLAFGYHGSQAGLSLDPNWTVGSDQLDDGFGNTVGTAGDVNGDGYDDVIVGSATYDNGQSNEGRALVFLGSAAGLSLTPDWRAEGNQFYAYFGWSVGTAGDVNGDGYADVIVGAVSYSNGQRDEGKVYFYQGSASGPSLLPDGTAESNQTDAALGGSVARAGHVNGDRYDDVIVGASGYDNGQTDEGSAFAIFGRGGSSAGV